ncbi:hypothetical protein [Haloferax sp. ATB1]|uniref:hypothetical protein n=1 Tax=Haloferax sp. ATB1 TaxID=1508454 RepID=UPI0005B1D252|nr:hypothetical protein [Haloferax sp. ATB1]
MGKESTHTRRRTLQSICGVAVAGLTGLAGCSSSGDSDQTTRATDAGTQTTTETQTTTTANETTANETTEQEKETTESGLEAADFVENPEEIHPTLVEETSVPSDEVLLGFRLEDSSLPFTTEVYRAPDDAEVQATETYDTQDLSEVDLLPDSPQALDTVDTDREDIHYGTTTIGEPLKVTLVARHDSDTIDWSAWSRTGYPYDGHNEEDPALEVDCYCGGMNYTAPSGGTWARVIQVTPTERVDTGTTVALNWTSSRL